MRIDLANMIYNPENKSKFKMALEKNFCIREIMPFEFESIIRFARFFSSTKLDGDRLILAYDDYALTNEFLCDDYEYKGFPAEKAFFVIYGNKEFLKQNKSEIERCAGRLEKFYPKEEISNHLYFIDSDVDTEMDEFADAVKNGTTNNKTNYNLNRFVDAQRNSYSVALREIQNGAKVSHWMWYIFPQLRALGKSQMATFYGIENFKEAKMYLAHPLLGERLREISEALLTLESDDPYRVMGSIDGTKLCSSMTLFAEVDGYDSVFGRVIDKFYKGCKDDKTLRLLSEEEV